MVWRLNEGIDHIDDSMGTAAAFKRKYPRVLILASEIEEPYISGKEKSLRVVQAEEMQAILPPEHKAFGEAFMDVLRRVEAIEVDAVLKDGDQFNWCGQCEIVATPGHTPGHISLYLPSERTVITGDAVALENGTPVIANPQFTLNMQQAKQSLDRLRSIDADKWICYHGGDYRPQG